MEVKLIMEEQTQIDSTQDDSESAEEQKQSLRDQISNALIGDDNTEEKVEETKEVEQPAEESEEQAEDSDEQEEVQQEEAKELEALKAPQHWPKDFSEQFDSWQPEVQHLFKERYDAMESDYTKKTQGLAKYKKRNEALDEIYGPF